MGNQQTILEKELDTYWTDLCGNTNEITVSYARKILRCYSAGKLVILPAYPKFTGMTTKKEIKNSLVIFNGKLFGALWSDVNDLEVKRVIDKFMDFEFGGWYNFLPDMSDSPFNTLSIITSLDSDLSYQIPSKSNPYMVASCLLKFLHDSQEPLFYVHHNYLIKLKKTSTSDIVIAEKILFSLPGLNVYVLDKLCNLFNKLVDQSSLAQIIHRICESIHLDSNDLAVNYLEILILKYPRDTFRKRLQLEDSMGRLKCKLGNICFHKELDHFKNFWHPHDLFARNKWRLILPRVHQDTSFGQLLKTLFKMNYSKQGLVCNVKGLKEAFTGENALKWLVSSGHSEEQAQHILREALFTI